MQHATLEDVCDQSLQESKMFQKLIKGHFPLGGIFHVERHFLLFKDQLAESGR